MSHSRISPPFPPRHRRQFGDEQGTALVTVILITAAILTMAVFGSRGAQIELRIARNDLLGKQALNAADAGLNHAYSLIKADPDDFNDELTYGGTGGSLAGLGAVTTLEDGLSYRFHAFPGGGANDGYYVRVADNYDEKIGANDPTKDDDNRVYIISRGRMGSAERIVQSQIKGTPLFGNALFGKVWVKVSGGAIVDSYDSRDGSYNPATATANGNVRSNGDITLGGTKSVVNGDATAGGTITLSGGSVITGVQTQSAAPYTTWSVPPCGPPYSPSTGITATGGASYNPATGAVSAVSGSTVTLAAGTYCFDTVSLNSGSTIAVTGPVIVYVTGVVSGSGATVNNTTGNPANFLLYSSYVNNGINGVALSGGSTTFIAVYAPDTNVQLSGGSDFFGAVVGTNISDTGGAPVHYDKALSNILGNITLVGWRDIRGG